MKIKSYLFVGLAALSLASCGSKGRNSLANLGNDHYPVVTVGASSADMQTTFPATIKGIQDVTVSPKVSGFITNVLVHEGQRVSAGQVLFTIDSETYRASVRSAQAAVNTAKAAANTAKTTYDNNQKLFDQHIIGQYELSISKNSLAQAQAQVAQAEAALASAKEQLAWCSVTSPASGVVGSLPYKKGALVSAATQLTTVSDVSTVEVFFSLNEAQMLSIQKQYGSTAGAINSFPTLKLQLADGTVYNHPGKLVKMSGVIDATTGSYSLIAHFTNPDGLLKSGGAGTIIVPRVHDNAIIIPQNSTAQVQDKIFIYKVDKDNKVHYSEVSVEPQNDGINYVVSKGLAVGDRYVVKGITKLTDGQAITPITEEQYEQEVKKAEQLGAAQGNAKDFANAMSSK